MKTQSFGRSTSSSSRFNMPTHPPFYAPSLLELLRSSLKEYKKARINGIVQDNIKPFPSAGFEILKIKSSCNKPNGPLKESYWPDALGRYWWQFVLDNGTIVEDFYWTKEAGGLDEKEEDSCFFSIHHAPSGIKIGGFSWKADREKGFPDANGSFWRYFQYQECGAIKAWMEERDQNYLTRREQGQISFSSDATSNTPACSTSTSATPLWFQRGGSAIQQSFHARALFNFSSQEEGDLSLRVGDVLEVINDSGQWWMGYNKQGQSGRFPFNYVERIKQNDLAAKGNTKHSPNQKAPAAVQDIPKTQLAAKQRDDVEQSLGEIDVTDQSILQSDAEAVKCLRLAAEEGNAQAQNNLGFIYKENKNYINAVRWYRKAAAQGEAAAQNNLGVMYNNGLGMDKDYAKALKWFHLAAAQEYTMAQYNLGLLYQYGRGVVQNYTEALKWYCLAAEGGNYEAKRNLAEIEKCGSNEEKFTLAKIYASGQYKYIGEENKENVLFTLAKMYENGRGVKKDEKEAIRLYHLAAEQGSSEAQVNLGARYEKGQGLPQSDAEAVKWYRKAAGQENTEAQNNLGLMYYYGRGVDQNYDEALKWFSLAVGKNHIKAKKYVLQLEAHINVKDNDDDTALHNAAKRDDNLKIGHLVTQGVNINAKDNDGRTALHYTAITDGTVTMAQLIAHGADINAKDNDGYTSLHHAAMADNTAAIEQLLQHGADINAKDNDGYTSLYHAAMANSTAAIEQLIRHGADVNAKINDYGCSILHGIVFNKKSSATIKQLIQHGVDVNAKDNGGWTALHYLTHSSDAEAIEQLIQHGVDVNAKDDNGSTILHRAATESDGPKIVALLLRHGADVNAKDNDGNTALHRASYSYDTFRIMEYLLQHGADINTKNNDGCSVLDFAVKHNYMYTDFLLKINMEGPYPAQSTRPEPKSTPALDKTLHDGKDNQEKNILKPNSPLKANSRPLPPAPKGVTPLRMSPAKPNTQKQTLAAQTRKWQLRGILKMEDDVKKSNAVIDYKNIQMGAELGSGGYGRVYKGEWCGTTVAVKELLSKKLSKEAEDNFEHEAAMMLQLRHPNILPLYGIILAPRYYMVIEYMARGSLYDVLHGGDILKWPRRYNIALDVARGLGYLHNLKKPVLHRDLKSANILVNTSYTAKLADFGLSRVKEVSSREFEAGMAGTHAWIAPELFLKAGTRFTAPCDVYSLGVIFWEILTRAQPYATLYHEMGLLGFLAEGKREDIPPNAPKVFTDIMQRCWAQNPRDRPTAQAVCEFMPKEPIQSHDEKGLSPRSAGKGRFVSSSCSSSSSATSSAAPVSSAAKQSGEKSAAYTGQASSPAIGFFGGEAGVSKESTTSVLIENKSNEDAYRLRMSGVSSSNSSSNKRNQSVVSMGGLKYSGVYSSVSPQNSTSMLSAKTHSSASLSNNSESIVMPAQNSSVASRAAFFERAANPALQHRQLPAVPNSASGGFVTKSKGVG